MLVMRKMIPLLFLLAFVTFCGTPPAETESAEGMDHETEAENMSVGAELQPTEGNSVSGTVSFKEMDGKVQISGHIMGLTPGKHGFHIHETGDCSAPDGSSAGGHFAPAGHAHGAPEAMEHHAGDLGNIEADAGGAAHIDMSVDFLTLGEGDNSIVGRAVIVHEGEDDLQSQPSGNAGARLACGVIQKGAAAAMHEGS